MALVTRAKTHSSSVAKQRKVVVGRRPFRRRRTTQPIKVLSYEADQKAKRLARAYGKARKLRKQKGEDEAQAEQAPIQMAPARRFKRGRMFPINLANV